MGELARLFENLRTHRTKKVRLPRKFPKIRTISSHFERSYTSSRISGTRCCFFCCNFCQFQYTATTMDIKILDAIAVTPAEKSQVTIVGELPWELAEKGRAAAVATLGKDIKIDGFRPRGAEAN